MGNCEGEAAFDFLAAEIEGKDIEPEDNEGAEHDGPFGEMEEGEGDYYGYEKQCG